MDFACIIADPHQVKIKGKGKKKMNKYLKTKKAMEYESDGDTNSNWYTYNDPQRLIKRAGRVGTQWLASSASKPIRVSSSLIWCPFHMALCHI